MDFAVVEALGSRSWVFRGLVRRGGRVEGVSGDAAGSGRPSVAGRLAMAEWEVERWSVESEEWGHWRW